MVRYGVLSSMHQDVRSIAPENLLQKQRMASTPVDSHLEYLIATRKRLQEDIKKERSRANVQSTVLGDKIDDLDKRARQVSAAINKRSMHLTSTIDLQHIIASARVVCSTVSSAINLKQ